MATSTLSCNALHTKTVKERTKTQKNCKSLKLNKSNAVGVGATAINPLSFYMLSGLDLVRKILW